MTVAATLALGQTGPTGSPPEAVPPPSSLEVANPGAADLSDLTLADRVVAAVDEDPILLSDVRRGIALGLVEPRPGESPAALERRVLDLLIEQRLRFHEVDRYELAPVPPEEVERQLAEIRDRFPDASSLADFLAELGLDEEGLRYLVTRRLAVLRYVEERLGPRVFVDPDEIRAFYDNELVPEMERSGTRVPPLEAVREEIRDILRGRRLNAEIVRWTEELRQKADVVDPLAHPPAALPPVVERLEAEAPP